MVIADSTRLAHEIELVLPKPLRRQRLKLLPQILEEWDRTDLREHLSRETRAVIRRRIEKLNRVGKRAGSLMSALSDLDAGDLTAIAAQMIIADGRRVLDVRRAEFAGIKKRLVEEGQFLATLSRIAPEEFWSFTSGQPRNIASYLVLKDAESIFLAY